MRRAIQASRKSPVAEDQQRPSAIPTGEPLAPAGFVHACRSPVALRPPAAIRVASTYCATGNSFCRAPVLASSSRVGPASSSAVASLSNRRCRVPSAWVASPFPRLASQGVRVGHTEGYVAFFTPPIHNFRLYLALTDDHDHPALQARFTEELELKGDVTGDYLSDEYEAGLSNSYRNKEGIYYTPSDIAGKFFKHLPEDRAQLTFCDPCCGTGNFLIEALGNGFSVANVYGFDTDGTAVEIAKRRIYEKTGMDSPNVRTEDFLRLVAERPKESGSYDVVLTNPPWGKKFDKKDKEFFAFKLGGRPTNDASALFFLAATRVVNTRGYLGMLLPDAFFNVTAFKDVRDKVLSYRLLSVTDFGRPFRALLTKAKGLLVQMDKPAENDLVACDTPSGQHKRPQQSFIANPKSILNFALSPSGADAISHLLAVPHRTLAGNARWRLGVLGVK